MFMQDFTRATFAHAHDAMGLNLAQRAVRRIRTEMRPGQARRFVTIVHTQFDTVEAAWREMERDGTCTVYQRASWMKATAQYLAQGPGCELAIVELRHALTDRPLMIWPLMRRRRHGRSRIEWLSCGVSDYAAPVIARGVTVNRAEAEAMWQAVLSALPPADLIWLDGIPETVGGIDNPLALLRCASRSSLETSGIAIDGDPETLLQRVCGRSFLREFTTKQKRLAKRGSVAFVVASTAEEVDALLAILIDQRVSRFRKLGRFDLLGESGTAAFYRDTAIQGLSDGTTRVFGLRCGGEWIAACTGLVHGGALHGSLLSIGTDAWRPLSPGLQLIAQTMIWSRQQGLDYVDFTVGALSYKAAMGAKSQPLLAYKSALTAKGAAVLQAMEASDAARAWLRSQPALRKHAQSGRRLLRMMARDPGGAKRATEGGLTQPVLASSS